MHRAQCHVRAMLKYARATKRTKALHSPRIPPETCFSKRTQVTAGRCQQNCELIDLRRYAQMSGPNNPSDSLSTYETSREADLCLGWLG